MLPSHVSLSASPKCCELALAQGVPMLSTLASRVIPSREVVAGIVGIVGFVGVAGMFGRIGIVSMHFVVCWPCCDQ